MMMRVSLTKYGVGVHRMTGSSRAIILDYPRRKCLVSPVYFLKAAPRSPLLFCAYTGNNGSSFSRKPKIYFSSRLFSRLSHAVNSDIKFTRKGFLLTYEAIKSSYVSFFLYHRVQETTYILSGFSVRIFVINTRK